MKKIILISTLIIVIVLAGLNSYDYKFENVKKELLKQGYTNIKYVGYSWDCCNDKDMFYDNFTALDSSGNIVRGVILNK